MHPLVDSHCHIDLKGFDKDISEVLSRINQHLAFVINVATDKKSNWKNLALAEKEPKIYTVLGLHPHDSATLDQELLSFLETNILHPKVVAIGEIGLDYYKNYAPKAVQQQTFRALLKLAKKYDKPVVLHSREATEDTLEILREEKITQAVFHCFTGGGEEARAILKAGYYLSFSGVITFAKEGALQEVVRQTPLDRFFVETDCPFLTPHPHRGKRNEPVFVKHVADEAARIKNLSPEDLYRQTTANVKKFFHIDHE